MEEHHPHWVRDASGQVAVDWDGDAPPDVRARQEAARRAIARAGRIDGLVWLALGVLVVHWILLFREGILDTLMLKPSPIVLTSLLALGTVPFSIAHLAWARRRNLGLPSQQRLQGWLLAFFIAVAATAPWWPEALAVAGFRASGNAGRMQAWAVRLLDTPKDRLPWEEPESDDLPWLERPRSVLPPLSIVHVTVMGVGPDRDRPVTPKDPWYPPERYVLVQRFIGQRRGFLIGRPDFVPRARRYAHLTRIQPGFYRFEEFSDR